MQPIHEQEGSDIRKVSLRISGMSCGHCVAAVREALAELPGVETTDVAIGAASVSIDTRVSSTDDVVRAIGEAGYEAAAATRPLPQAPVGSCCSADAEMVVTGRADEPAQ